MYCKTPIRIFIERLRVAKNPSVLAEIKAREARLLEIEQEQRSLADARVALSASEIRALCGERLGRFKDLLYGDVAVARQALRIPFAPTQAAREAAKDSRASMAERYKDRETYLTKVRESAQALPKEGYLLEEDIDRVVARADRNAKFENGAQYT